MEVMEKVCEKIDRAIGVFETVFLAVSLSLMAGALFAQAVMGFFGLSMAWVNELSMYMLVWTMCVGASAATRGRRHITIGIVADRLRERPARAMKIAVSAICVLFCASAFKLGFDYAEMAYDLGQRSVAIGLPLWIVYSALPLAAALAAIRFALLVFEKD
jgi:TRAP-type C4-dicarboxylate transport system permease small subunit